MKKAYLINYFDIEGKYNSTLQIVFLTKESAIKYREKLNNKDGIYCICEVNIK